MGVTGLGGDETVGESGVCTVRQPRSDGVSSTIILFARGCPGILEMLASDECADEGTTQGARGERDAGAIGDTDLRFKGTRLLAPSES